MSQSRAVDLLRQRQFGHYEILDRLGSGGMGEVFRAKDQNLGREVAIKVLAAAAASNQERLERFEREARSASALNHPNIVTIYEIGSVDETRYIAMELVEGKTLRELMVGGPLVTRRALQLAAQAADGLAQAHASGIVHRDLKPENIMVTKDGRAKILDFGLAKLVAPPPSDESSTESTEAPGTGPGAILGTVRYMSPEQALGRPVDFRSDQFSCGSILYEMATGKPAFRRESAVQTLSAIIEDEPEPIATLNPNVPAPLRWIIERCLAKEPAGRYASTQDLARDLSNVLEHLAEVSSGPHTAAHSARRWRRTFAATAAAGVGALLVALLPATREWVRDRMRPIPRQKQIAILAFTNSNGDPSDRALCDGLVETLTTKLTQLQQFQGALLVVPVSEVRQAKVSNARDARRAFGVNLALTGGIQRSGDRLRLTANLVDADSLRQLRAVTMDSEMTDVLELQDGIVERVADMLELELRPEAKRVLAAGRTTVSGAYDLYLQGRGHLQRYESAGSLEQAIALFQRALEQDPRYALAYAGLGEAYWRRYELTKERQSADLAERSCAKAVELNDLLAVVHITLGLIHTGTGRYEQGVKDLETALALDPTNPDAYRELASAHDSTGNVREAEITYKRAIALRPGYWSGHNRLGFFYTAHGRYAEAEPEFRRVIEITPDNVRGYNNLGGLYHLMGRYQEAGEWLRKSLAIQPTADAYSNLGTVYFFEGRYRDAVPMMEKAIAMGAGDHVVWGNLADAYRWTQGPAQKTEQAYRRAVQLSESELAVNANDAQVHAYLASYWAKLGNQQKALAEIAEARRLAPSDPKVDFKSVIVFELAGRRDPALAALGAALGEGYSIDEIRRDPDLGALRQDPRYARLLERRPAVARSQG